MFTARHLRTVAAVSALGALTISMAGASGLWSDSDRTNGNKVQAGVISVDAREVDNKPIASQLIVNGVGGLLPGEEGSPGTVDVYNDGTREANQFMHVENVSGALCNYVNLRLGWSFGAVNAFDNSLGTHNLTALAGAGNRIEVGRTHPVPDNGTTRVVQAASLDANTPQSLAGATCTWDEVFTAEQNA